VGGRCHVFRDRHRVYGEISPDGFVPWADTLSEAQASVIKRVSTLEVECEALEARLSAGQPVELAQYGRIASRLCRLLGLIGIQRLARPTDPTGDLARAFEACPAQPIDDDDGDEPGEA